MPDHASFYVARVAAVMVAGLRVGADCAQGCDLAYVILSRAAAGHRVCSWCWPCGKPPYSFAKGASNGRRNKTWRTEARSDGRRGEQEAPRSPSRLHEPEEATAAAANGAQLQQREAREELVSFGRYRRDRRSRTRGNASVPSLLFIACYRPAGAHGRAAASSVP